MAKKRLPAFSFLLVFVLNTCPVACFGQLNADTAARWAEIFSRKEPEPRRLFYQKQASAAALSPKERKLFFEALGKHGDASNPYFQARYYVFQAAVAYNNAYPGKSDSVAPLFLKALKIAYETGDEPFIGDISWRFGELMNNYNNIELAVMYCLSAAEINKKLGQSLDGIQNWKLGEVLYKIREYEKTIYYCKAAVPLMGVNHIWLANCINTIALSYQKLGLYDSALYYYDSAYVATKNYFPDVWRGIISGNKGQVYFLQGMYTKALPLFELDIKQSKIFELFDNAANSLQWAAKTNLVTGNQSLALAQVREALYLLAKNPVRNYYQNLFQTSAEVYRAAGMPDSAYYFSARYLALHDSIESEITLSRLEISRIKLENEKSYYQIRNIQQQRKEEINNRNLSIAAILLLAGIAFLYLNSLRVKTLHRQQLMTEKNRNAENEIAAAREQLELFTSSLVEKSALINQLQDTIHDNSLTSSQQEVYSRLLQSTIITEEQWTAFKTLLEKLHPGFFYRLKETYPAITIAEQRMAALIKLKLATREIAAMLGISVESVHKTRQRLKQRLNLATEINLEDFIASF